MSFIVWKEIEMYFNDTFLFYALKSFYHKYECHTAELRSVAFQIIVVVLFLFLNVELTLATVLLREHYLNTTW